MVQLINTLGDRKAFDGGRQFAWDSTSLGAFKKCPRYYQLTILEGWTGRIESPHLKFGILFHEATEMMDQRRLENPLNDVDLIHILREIMIRAGRRDEAGVFRHWASPHDKKNLESLIRAVIWYFDTYKDDALTTVRLANGRAATELSFRFDLPLGDYIYCGHLDRLVEYSGAVYFLDRKTSGSALGPMFFAQFSPNLQMGGYSVASRLVYQIPSSGGIIDAMQVGAGFVRFGRHVISHTEEILEEWLHNTMASIQLAERYSTQGHFPMNESACGMYGGCVMQQICSKTPSMRERFLRAEFVQRGWDPLEPRGTDT